jgi:hypothetical protein
MGDFKKAVKDAGYEILEMERVEKEDIVDREKAAREAEYGKLKRKFIAGVILVSPIFLLGHWKTLGLSNLYDLSREVNFYLQLIFQTPIQFWVGWQFYVGAWKTAKHKSADMNTLIAPVRGKGQGSDLRGHQETDRVTGKDSQGCEGWPGDGYPRGRSRNGGSRGSEARGEDPRRWDCQRRTLFSGRIDDHR